MGIELSSLGPHIQSSRIKVATTPRLAFLRRVVTGLGIIGKVPPDFTKPQPWFSQQLKPLDTISMPRPKKKMYEVSHVHLV